MVLVHGFVHGDPHAGNVHVRAHPVTKDAQIVILDHGLYHEIDDKLRSDFCELVHSCILMRRSRIRTLGEQFAGPLHRYFPLVSEPTWEDSSTSIRPVDILACGARMRADRACRQKLCYTWAGQSVPWRGE